MRYKLRLYIKLIFIVCALLSISFVFFWINLAINNPEKLIDSTVIVTSILLLLIFGPPIIITISYFLEDFKKKVNIDSISKTLFVEYKGEKIEISKKDVVELFYVKVDSQNRARYKYPFYEYIIFVLKDRKKLIVTNLIVRPEKILELLGLNPKMIYMNLPFLDRKIGSLFLSQKEHNMKVREFYEKFKNKSENELLSICNQIDYADYAKSAARQLLNEKK